MIARYFATEKIKNIHRNYTERINVLLCYEGDCDCCFILKYRYNTASTFNWQSMSLTNIGRFYHKDD